MKKQASTMNVGDLAQQFRQINFPEYQRESTVWFLNAKRRLIDSMARQFDIASVYLYRNEDDSLDCVDGRQRIGAIMSFLGKNPTDVEDNGFTFRPLNEIYEDGDTYEYAGLEGLTYREIAESSEEIARRFVRRLNEYRITVVELSGAERPEEFNLQFTRLNLGSIIISGEKLNAMVGDMRDLCFGALGHHAFFQETKMYTRRFSREQTAAQVVAQVFCHEEWERGESPHRFARTRHLDLQSFFKKNSEIGGERENWVAKLSTVLDLLAAAFERSTVLRNRAVIVSTVLLAYTHGITTRDDAESLAEFVEEFVRCLHEQMERVKRGEAAEPGYHYFVEFQRHLTQASVERKAVGERAGILEEQFGSWMNVGELSRVEGGE